MEESQSESLSQLFDKSLSLHSEIIESNEETKSETFQDSVKKGILMLEDATRLVSILDIFSSNENYSEVPTDHLKFFLLPVLLGKLITLHGLVKLQGSRQGFYLYNSL